MEPMGFTFTRITAIQVFEKVQFAYYSSEPSARLADFSNCTVAEGVRTTMALTLIQWGWKRLLRI
jgi:hypothetical protein